MQLNINLERVRDLRKALADLEAECEPLRARVTAQAEENEAAEESLLESRAATAAAEENGVAAVEECRRLTVEVEQLRQLRARVQQQQRQLASTADEIGRLRSEGERHSAELAKRDEELQRLRTELATLRKLKVVVAEQANQLSLTSARIADAQAAEAASNRKLELGQAEVRKMRDEMRRVREEWAAVSAVDGQDVNRLQVGGRERASVTDRRSIGYRWEEEREPVRL